MSRPQLLAVLLLPVLVPAAALAESELAPPGVCARIGDLPELGPLVTRALDLDEIDVAAGAAASGPGGDAGVTPGDSSSADPGRLAASRAPAGPHPGGSPLAGGPGTGEGFPAGAGDWPTSGGASDTPPADPGAGLPGAIAALFGPVDVAAGGAGPGGLPLPQSAGFGGVGPCESPARCVPASGLPVGGGGPPPTGITEPGPDLGLDAPGVSR